MSGNNSFMTSLLSLLDDNKFVTDAVSKPCHGTGQFNVKYYLNLVQKILNQATAIVDDLVKNTQPKGDECQSKSSTSLSTEAYSPLSSTINELCYLITCKARANDVQQTMASLLNLLSSFSWDAKAVLTLLALSVYYAEHWRLAQIEESDNLLSLTARLRGLHAIGKSSDTQRTKALVALNDLIKVTLEFTKCALDFVNYSNASGEHSTSIDMSARFYYIIVIVLGCAVQFSGLISMSNEFLGQDLWTFSDRVRTKYESFKKEVENLREKHAEQISYEKIKKISKDCTDVVELMAALFCTKNDLTVYQCCKKTPVKVEKFKDKIVMLLISDLDLSDEDKDTLTSIYNECNFHSGNYKIMWVPIAEEQNEAMQKKFLDKRSEMRWYTSNSMIGKPAAKFIQKKWQFRRQTKVVVLNQQGKVVNMDAMAMIRLWGREAFPFTESKGQELWNRHGINWFKLVVNNTLFPYVERGFEEGELIILYSSAEDIQTVEKVTKYLDELAICLASYRCINVSTKREQFLTRLESCLYLKMQASSDVYDSRAQELLELYTNYKHCGGFAVIARGSTVVVNARLEDFEAALSLPKEWPAQAQDSEAAFKARYDEVVQKKPRCHRFYIPKAVGNMPECVKCAKCSRYMKAAVEFECCHGDQPMMPPCPEPPISPRRFRDSAVAAAPEAGDSATVLKATTATPQMPRSGWV